MTVPCLWNEGNLIVGEDMQDFLGLGCQTGYFCLEQLLYQRRATIDRIAHPEQPFQASVEEQEALELLRTTFALTP